MINSQTEVLVESFKGKKSRFEKVIFQGDISLVNSFQKVKLIDFKHQTFIGEKKLI